MDETEKYKQRLEAIAEKRRLQEEQDRAKREMEDEKLRLQQLKRKSLRDQWLMEGAPLSPTSLDTQSPPSPLWGFQTQENENHTDRLQSESEQLAEEKENLKEQMEDGQTEAVKSAEAKEEKAWSNVVQNGENNASELEAIKDQLKINQRLPLVESAVVLTNGGKNENTNTSNRALEQSTQPTTNGPAGDTEAVVSMNVEGVLILGVSEAESGQVPAVSNNEEEEEGTLVMRAECVIITDEGNDVPEDLTPQEDQQEMAQSEESSPPNPETSKEEGKVVEGLLKTEVSPETIKQTDKSEATEITAEPQPATEDVDVEGEIKTNEEKNAAGQDKQSEGLTSVPPQSQASALESTTEDSVPAHSEAQPSTVTPEAEDEVELSPEGAETAFEAEAHVTLPDEFQEVPLSDSQEDQRADTLPAEKEPLLLQAKTPCTQEEPAAAKSPSSRDLHSTASAIQGEETEVPKHKACQCCTVM
uniref:Paralemmin 3 n=2 Tax=Monopterus albus TaxID=43700 RepID=A0A3Q3KLG3_MONAL|nr:paralemmin-3-like isoform X1 [Monopterus albus]XP_020452707.1 paralemmin-3-like isoform X1 [Monopterus albus]XP_020452708.1 paralemmin-3-like isoform X1 [Monopterus albus]XP_020452709.1 paralemmin-3-like isoform X1 [Monopterus albus]